MVLDYAIDARDKSLKYIDEVSVGVSCGCICPICNEPLIAYNNGSIQAHHFGHHSGVEHLINPMTRLHMLAQIILAKSFSFKLEYDVDDRLYTLNSELNDLGLEIDESKINIQRRLNLVDKVFSNGESEYVKMTAHGALRYDVYFPNANLAVEVYVTHHVDSEKKRKIDEAGDWCVELDLSEVDRNISYENLELILKDFVFHNRIGIFGVGEYVQYIDRVLKQHDDFLEEVLPVSCLSGMSGFNLKRQVLESLFEKYGANRITSEAIQELTNNGVEKLYDELTDINFSVLYSQLHHFEISLIKQPVPHRYGIRNVSLRLRARDDYGTLSYTKFIRIGWIYMPG